MATKTVIVTKQKLLKAFQMWDAQSSRMTKKEQAANKRRHSTKAIWNKAAAAYLFTTLKGLEG